MRERPMTEVEVEIWRSDGDGGRFASYPVPLGEGRTVLDAVKYVRDNFEPDLAFRYNCGSGRCGSCGAEVNGEPVLMCTTPLEGDVTVRPMETFPIVRDLVVDLSENWEVSRRLPAFESGEEWRERVYPEDVRDVSEFERCIECFLCQDVCHVLREHGQDYVGPRFVTRLASLNRHPRDDGDRSRFSAEGGLEFCNVTRCCQDVCPEGIRITDEAIIPEKERLVSYLDPFVGLYRQLFG